MLIQFPMLVMLEFVKLTFASIFFGFESKWIKVTCPNIDINYVIGTVYCYPNSNENEFNDYLNKILTNLNMNHKHCFIRGDINIHTDKKVLSNGAKNYLNMLSSNDSKNMFDM